MRKGQFMRDSEGNSGLGDQATDTRVVGTPGEVNPSAQCVTCSCSCTWDGDMMHQ